MSYEDMVFDIIEEKGQLKLMLNDGECETIRVSFFSDIRGYINQVTEWINKIFQYNGVLRNVVLEEDLVNDLIKAVVGLDRLRHIDKMGLSTMEISEAIEDYAIEKMK